MQTKAWLERYSRQICLPFIGENGQQKLLNAHVVIVGMGGLGSPVALYLAASGVGRLTLVDFDEVDRANLQRQIIHFEADIGKLKVDSAREKLLALNPNVQVKTVPELLSEEAFSKLIDGVTLVVDCTDNFITRYSINRVCFKAKVPFVSGAAIRTEGQVTVFDPNNPQSPCYACLYPEKDLPFETCSQAGVAAPLVGIVGSVQAMEAIKFVVGGVPTLIGRLWFLDALTMECRVLAFSPDPSCPVCSNSTSPTTY